MKLIVHIEKHTIILLQKMDLEFIYCKNIEKDAHKHDNKFLL